MPTTSKTLDGTIISKQSAFNSDGTIKYLALTNSTTYLSSQVWLQTAADFQNGFETEFQVDISTIGCRASTCASGSMFICTYETQRSCGGDGFAFVMQASDAKKKGAAGSGLGYSGVMNSIVVEFDAVTNAAKNDPKNTIERHISLIAVNGQNLADETYAIARNENPLNFKNAENSNFLQNPTIKIQYLNDNWRVFMNGALQLGYYSPFPLSKIFLPGQATWIGITASTSDVTAMYKILSWAVRMVVPSTAKSTAVPSATSVKSKYDFTIDIQLRDECGNAYVPVAGFDSIEDILYDKASITDCDLRDRTTGTDGSFAYRFKFNCANVGMHTFSFSYNSSNTVQALTPVQVNILPGDFTRAALNFLWGTQATIDTGIKFQFVAYDFSKNVVDVTNDQVLAKLGIVFPNAANSVKNFAIQKQSDKTFLVTFTTDLIGNYYIQDQIFILEVALGRYDFNFVEGDVVIGNSWAKLYEGNINVDTTQANELTRTVIPAGTALTLKIVYRDRVGNQISSSRITTSSMSEQVFIDGVSGLLTDVRPGARLFYSFLNVNKAGIYSVKTLYNNQEVVCSNCLFSVTPLAADFTHSSLFQYDFTAGKYNTQITNNFNINKGDPFNFKLLLRDIYDNVVRVPDVGAFTSTLSGNYMKVLTLILSNVEDGVKLEVSSGDRDYYNNLVGRNNYNITVVQTATKNWKNWTLGIKSDGSDSDSGNSDIEPIRTTLVWLDPVGMAKGEVAGILNSAMLTLKNKEGSRYNGWLDEATIPKNLLYLNTDKGETLSAIKRGLQKGTYYIDVVTTVVLGKFNALSVKIVTVNKTLPFKTIPGPGYQGIVDPLALKDANNLLDGTVNKPYNFTFRTYDKYLNPQDVDATNLVLKSLDDPTISAAVQTTRVDLGLYTCLVTPTFPGRYSLNSVFISNAVVNTYNVYFRRGAPSAKTSIATVVEDVSLGKVAGSTVTLKISSKDESGLSLTKDEVVNALSGFTANVKEPGLDGFTSIPLVSVQQNGDILATFTLTRAGQNVFSAYYNSSSLQCLVCSVIVFAGDVDLTKISTFYLSISTAGNVESPLSSVTAFIIDNTVIDPIFLMRFSDKFGNRRNFSSDLSFTGALNVPNGAQKTYTLQSAAWGDAIKFIISDAQIKYFHSELKNNNVTGVFSAVSSVSKNSGQVVDKLIFTGGSDDDIYSNDDIDPKVSKVDPTTLSFTVGDWVDLNIELRVTNGRLYNFPLTFGWYTAPDSSFQLKLSDGNTLNGGIKPGKLKGTYTIHFTCYKAYSNGINMTIYYLDPKDNVTFIPLFTTVRLYVSPGLLSYLVLDDPTLIADTTAGDSKALTFYPYDKFTNLIPKLSLTSMNFNISSSSAENIIPAIIQKADGGVVVSYTAQKVATLVLTALKFKDKSGSIVANYTYNVNPAALHYQHCIATLDKDSLNAGDKVTWMIFPRDAYDNYVPLTAAGAALLSGSRNEPGAASPIFITADPLLGYATTGNFYYWTFTLTKAGTHEFKAFLGDQIINSNKFRAVVSPVAADFLSSTLGLYKVLSSVYELYNGNFFEQDVSALPDLKVLLFDVYKNPVTALPSTWNLRLYLTSNELGDKNGIILCKQTDGVTFRMCTDNSLQPDLVTPAKRWGDLVVPKNYTLMLNNGAALNNFTMELTGNSTGDDSSNLPIDVQNTILTPDSLSTTVNVSASFQIFVMTTNPNLRRNEWFDNPMASIKLSFALNGSNIQYNIVYGEKKGIYKVTVLSTIAYPINPNLITVAITNITVKNKNVKLTVSPGAPDVILPYNAQTQQVLAALPSITVDTHFTQAFIAKDIFNNLIDLNSDTPGANSLITGPTGETIVHNKAFPIDSVAMILDFQPKYPGTFTVTFNAKSKYTFTVTQGSVNPGQSVATVSPSTVVAGGQVTVTIIPKDQFGNLLSITDVSPYIYYVAPPTDNNAYSAGTGQAQIIESGTKVTFTQTVTIKGNYVFKTSIGGNAITMTLSRVTVTPAAVSLKDSLLQYYDTTLMKYANAAKENPIKEDNIKYFPRYLLFLADKYGNMYDNFPAELQYDFNVYLFGNDFKQSAPVMYDADQTQGAALYITVADVDKQRYQNGIFEQTPYNLSLTLTTTQETVYYPIILLGEGSDDNNADIEIPMDITKTFISKYALTFVAGLSDNFLLEIRTALGTRKADIGNPSFTFKFQQPDNLTDGNFNASYIKGDLRGRFLVTVTGTKANNMVGPTLLSITINGLGVPKTVNVTVTPAALDHADLIQYMADTSADTDYAFNIVPRDQFNNVPLIKPTDLNLFVTFPVGVIGAKDFSGETDLSNLNVKFTVKSRYAGVYTISSQYIPASANFSVYPGAPNNQFTQVLVSPSQLRAGESASVQITPFDAYNNRILPLSTRGNECLAALQINSVLLGEVRNYNLTVDAANNVLLSSFVYTKVGLVSVIVNVNQAPVVCSSCAVTYTPAAIALSHTKFFTVSSLGSNSTSKVTFESGRTDLNLLAQLFDRFDNSIQQLLTDDAFTLVLSGNNMDTMNMALDKNPNSTNTLDISVLPEEASDFSRLVPADNYVLTLTYLYTNKVNQTTTLGLQLTGDDNGGGNGPYVLENTYVNPLNLTLMAGEEGTVVVELRTSENKRFNGFFDINRILASEANTSYSNNDPLALSFYFGEFSGRFKLSVKSFKAMPAGTLKKIQVSVAGQVLKTFVGVFITPNTPDISKTNVTLPLPFTLYSNAETQCRIKLYDTYNNLYALPDWASKITGMTISGQSTFGATTFDSKTNEYVVKVTAIYPPRVTSVQLYFNQAPGRQFPILQFPFVSQILTQLDITKTQLTGSQLPGVPIGSDFGFNILLKDSAGYCYETTKTVQVVISGPYKYSNMTTKDVVSGALLLQLEPVVKTMTPVTNDSSTQIQSNGYICNRFYSIQVYGNQLQTSGFYQIDVYVPEAKPDAVLSVRNTFMGPGDVSPAASQISLQGVVLPSVDSWSLPVNSPFVVRVQLRDSFKNVISSSASVSFSFAFSDSTLKPTSDWTQKLLAQGKGYFDLQLTIFKVGSLPTGSFTINNQTVLWSALDSFNFPRTVSVTPGPCASQVPGLDNSALTSKGAFIGNKANFLLTCYDSYGNLVNHGGDTFTVQIIGTDIATAKSESIPNTVTDKTTGQYLVEFVPNWPGLYTVTVQLNGGSYTAGWSFSAKGSSCPSDKPYICVNNNQCVASYRDCGYADLNCPSASLPFLCNVNGAPTCVSAQSQCDCETSDYLKCNSDQKCVYITDVDAVCSLSGQNPGTITCPSTATVVCGDGSCRADAADCPSPVGCPPQYRLCMDQSCALKNSSCPNRPTDPCPNDRFYRCDDFSCVPDPTLCPTSITCPVAGQVVCPNRQCADSELHCGAVNQCPNQVICHDGSCAATYDDCPTGIVCPVGQALCVDGSCKDSCTTTTPSRLLFRLLRSLQSNETSGCAANKVTCRLGGECVDNQNSCPSSLTCASGEVQCSAMACAKSLNECPPKVSCSSDQVLCWDNSCADNQGECPTRISCPSLFPKLCSDGSCLASTEKCPAAGKCPSSRPFMCGSGDCRKKADDCPTQKTCPETFNYKCQDGSCVSNKENCNAKVKASRCAADSVRCGDGSCAESREKCSTMPTCLTGQLRCWDSKCVDTPAECTPIETSSEDVCPSTANIQCSDGSCAKSLAQCPTQVICPNNFPIKCEDGNCRASKDDCLPYTYCPDGSMKSDGTCADKSGTTVTCSAKEPYKCFDGTCRNHPFNCPDYRECPSVTPIRCSSGECVSARVDCPVLKVCASGEVLCPDLSCQESVDKCHRQEGCPSGRVLCEDGSCLSSETFCRNPGCPAHLPLQCADGFCVSNLALCDLSNGCPYNQPIKCGDGRCTDNATSCPSNLTLSCKNGDVLCPDGSCASHQKKCPLANGCPVESPQKCSNGDCINPRSDRCSVSRCPKATPVKCLNGICVKSKQACSSVYNPEPDSQCTNGTLYCADGRCVTSLDQCRPVSGCGKLHRCGDGSCKMDARKCPLVNNTCPGKNNLRCENGACVSDELDCVLANGCPGRFPNKCPQTGICAANTSQCDAEAKKVYLTNNCTAYAPYSQNGSCVIIPNDTQAKVAPNCSNNTVACADGRCLANYSLCSECPEGFEKCSSDSKTCVKTGQTQTCPNFNGCPVGSPFKCADGSCVKSFKDLHSCKPHLTCLDEPDKYQCADGNCEMSQDNCKVLWPCSDNQVRCADLSCAASLSSCPQKAICPPTSSFRCRSGKCVDSIEECNEAVCAGVLCYNGQCVNSSAYCVSAAQRKGSFKSRRVLVETADTTNVTTNGNGCPISSPYLCGDGTCQSTKAECSIVPGCFDLLKPYRCWDGSCVDSNSSCPAAETCELGSRCEDGICRTSCPDFDGCPLSAPYQCANGECATNSNGCLKSGKVQCSDHSVTSSASLCTRALNTLRTQSIDLTISATGSAVSTSFVTDDATTIEWAVLLIPEGVFSGSQNALVQLRPVPSSLVLNTDILQQHTDVVQSVFATDKLSSQQFLRSAIFNLTSSSASFNRALNLSIEVDVLQGTTGYDYCLAQLDQLHNSRWSCVSRANLDGLNLNDTTLNFAVPSTGVWAVAFVPDYDHTTKQVASSSSDGDWWSDNKGTVLGVLIGFIASILVLGLAVYGYLKYSRKEAKGDRLLSEADEKKLDDMGRQLSQKDKIIQETTQECNNSKEQNIKLTHEIENLQAEISKMKEQAAN